MNCQTLLRRGLSPQVILQVSRVVCVIGISYFTAQVILSGTKTLGAIIASLVPALIIGGILLVIELRKGNLKISLPALPNKRAVVIATVAGLVLGVSIVLFCVCESTVDLIMVVLVVGAMCLSGIYQLEGKGVSALCVFIFVWPLITFELSGHVFFRWNKWFQGIFANWQGIIVMDVYIFLLIFTWVVHVLLNKEHLVSATWAPSIWLFAIASFLSVVFSSNFQISLMRSIDLVWLPLLFFIFCVNIVHTLDDFEKISLAIVASIGIITVVWLYYALYRYPMTAFTVAALQGARGGGGRLFGSLYEGYNGVYFDILCPLVLPSVLALIFSAVKKNIRYVWVSIAILMIGAEVYSFGRVGWIATLLCLFPWMWPYKTLRVLSVALLILLVCFFSVSSDPIAVFFGRFKEIASWDNFQKSDYYVIWKGAANMFQDNPWTGVGVGLFDLFSFDYGVLSFKNARKFGFLPHQPVIWCEAHSTFFQMISTMGLLGLVAWVFILWIPLRRLVFHKSISSKLSFYKHPWRMAMQSYTYVLIFYMFSTVGLLQWGISEIRIMLIYFYLAVFCVEKDFLKTV